MHGFGRLCTCIYVRLNMICAMRHHTASNENSHDRKCCFFDKWQNVSSWTLHRISLVGVFHRNKLKFACAVLLTDAGWSQPREGFGFFRLVIDVHITETNTLQRQKVKSHPQPLQCLSQWQKYGAHLGWLIAQQQACTAREMRRSTLLLRPSHCANLQIFCTDADNMSTSCQMIIDIVLPQVRAAVHLRELFHMAWPRSLLPIHSLITECLEAMHMMILCIHARNSTDKWQQLPTGQDTKSCNACHAPHAMDIQSNQNMAHSGNAKAEDWANVLDIWCVPERISSSTPVQALIRMGTFRNGWTWMDPL